MKKINILCIVILFVITACSRSNDEVSIIDGGQYVTNGTLAQKWICQKVLAEGKEPLLKNDNTGQVLLEAQAFGESYDENYSISFTEFPNKITSEGTFNLNITINFVDKTGTGAFNIDPVVENIINPSLLGDGDWNRVSQNRVTIVTNVRTIDATIVELTDTKLVLRALLPDFPVKYGDNTYLIDILSLMEFVKG